MRRTVLMAGILLAAACSRAPQVRYYSFELDPPARAVAALPTILWVQPFGALPACDQDRMVFRDTAFEIQFDAYRRWIAPPPSLLREQLVEYLRASGRFSAVVTTPPRQASFAALSVQVVRFDEMLEAGKRQGITRLWFELADERAVLQSSGYIEGKAEIGAGNGEVLVAAMRASAAQAFKELFARIGS
jgi:cholesterol transport system auxiliary component